MNPQPPPGQGPIDPRGAFSPPPPPGGTQGGYGPPPGYFMPAPMFYPPPKRERGFARAIFTTLATSIFGLSILLNLYLIAFSGLMNGRSSQTNTLVDGDPQQKIAVVPIVNSMMLEKEAEQFIKQMDLVENDSAVKAVVIQIDTPGGSVTSADEIFHRIKMYKSRKSGIPVVVTMGGMATSGGYYAACAGDYLFAQPTTLTGNIGVLMPRYNIAKLADKYGIEDATLHSTGADFKTAGSWMKPEKPEDRAYMLGIIDSAFGKFKDVVASGRTGKLTKPIDQIANGKAYTADEAKDLGLVDAIGYPADAYAHAAQAAGLKNMTVVKFQEPTSILSLLSQSASTLPERSAGGEGVSFRVDADAIRQLVTPRMMYIWQGE